MSSTLIKAVADARAMALDVPNSAEYRNVLRHAREMHDRFIDALRGREDLSPHHLSLSRIAGETIAILDAHAQGPHDD